MMHDLALAFRKSTRSNEQGACCEVAELPNGGRAVRDSKNPAGAVLRFSAAQWSAFTDGMKAEQFG